VLRSCNHQRKRRPGERAALVLLVAAITAPGEEKQDEEVTSRAPGPMCFFTHCILMDIASGTRGVRTVECMRIVVVLYSSGAGVDGA
jgi:hypothetical protein